MTLDSIAKKYTFRSPAKFPLELEDDDQPGPSSLPPWPGPAFSRSEPSSSRQPIYVDSEDEYEEVYASVKDSSPLMQDGGDESWDARQALKVALTKLDEEVSRILLETPKDTDPASDQIGTSSDSTSTSTPPKTPIRAQGSRIPNL
jgi:hypothetical protein